MKEKLTTQFMEHNVFAAMDEPPPGVKPVGIGDGYGDHFNLETLDYLRNKPADLVLRPPHTSQASQGEDVIGFAVLKPALRKRKLIVLGDKITAKKGARLTLDDYGECVKQPTEHAFSRERNLKSWAAIDVSPFNRHVYWELKEQEDAAAAALGQTDAPVWNKAAAVFPRNSSAGGEGSSAGGGGGGDAEEDDRDGDDDDEAPTGTDRSAHNRLTSADLWDVGAVTADSAHALVKAKRDAQLQREQEKEARKQSKQAAATARLSTAVQESQHAIARLQSQGFALASMSASDLSSKCSAKELEALLLTTDPQAKKGNKSDMAERIVAYATHISQATAPAAAPAAAAAAGP